MMGTQCVQRALKAANHAGSTKRVSYEELSFGSSALTHAVSRQSKCGVPVRYTSSVLARCRRIAGAISAQAFADTKRTKRRNFLQIGKHIGNQSGRIKEKEAATRNDNVRAGGMASGNRGLVEGGHESETMIRELEIRAPRVSVADSTRPGAGKGEHLSCYPLCTYQLRSFL